MTRVQPFVLSVLTSAILSCGSVAAQSLEDASAACEEAVQLIDDDDIDGALEEARWCVESLEQVRRQATLQHFPDTVAGFTGGEIERQNALGMNTIERRYEKADDSVEVSLMSGSAGNGMAALAQLGMTLVGDAVTGRKLRIQKRTVIDTSEEAETGPASFMVQLRSGGVLNVSSDTLEKGDVLDFMRAFPIAELDDAIP